VREWKLGIDGERGEHRKDLLHEACGEARLDGCVEIGPFHELGSFRAELFDKGSPGLLLRLCQELCCLADCLHLLRRRPSIGTSGTNARIDLLANTGDPNAIELVEIRLDDAEEPEPIEQRCASILRFVEDARVEGQHREFAADLRDTHIDTVLAAHESAPRG